MELVMSGSAATTGDGSNSKRKLDLGHSTPMTVLSMDSQSKVRRRGSSLSSNDSTVMKRSLSDGTMYVVQQLARDAEDPPRVTHRCWSLSPTRNDGAFSDVSDSEQDTDDCVRRHGGAPSCPISPASTGSDSVNEATAQLNAMSPRDTIPLTVIRTSPFSPVFTSPSRVAVNNLPGSARNSPLPSPLNPSPARNLPGSLPSSPHEEQTQSRLSAPAAFSLGLPNHPPGRSNSFSVAPVGRGATAVKRAWPPLRKGRNPGNLSLDLSEMAPPSAAAVEGTTQRRNDQAAVCSQVTDFLYIGGAAAAKDRDNLMQVGITHIINCAANIAPAFYPDDFQYYNIKLRDHSGQDISRYFYNVFDFIEKARRRGGKVFVHCVKGISRSPTMAIAYLMWYKRMSMLKALELVRQARPAVDPNTGFIFQLNEWEHLRTNGALNLRHPVVFQIDVPEGNNGNGNGARAAEKPLVIGPLTTITEAKLSQAPVDSAIHKSCFVVSSAEYMFLWCGACVSEVHLEAAQHAITLLQTFESVPEKYEIVMSGRESPVFWSLLDAQHPHTSM